MIIVKTFFRSAILDQFTRCLRDSDIDNIVINGTKKSSNNYSALSRETIEVEFLAEESRIGKVVKRMVESANKGNFGKHEILLAPFRSI